MRLNKKGWQFVCITCILSLIPYYFIVVNGDSNTSWTLLLMWVPGLSAIIMRMVHKEGFLSGSVWNPLKDLKWLFMASFIPLAIEIASIVLTLGFDGAQLRPGFMTIENDLIALKGVAMIFGAGPQPWYVLLPNYLMSYFVGVLLYGLLFAFGEEYGWRGYLQKEWANNHQLAGFVMIGVIWGLWHLPAILMGHNYPEYPFLGGIILMPLLCVFFSISFGIAKNRKHVIWVAVLFHSGLNLSAEVSNSVLMEEGLNRPLNDAIWTFLWAVTTAIIFSKRKDRIRVIKIGS
ncbi:CPBP family intramembrane metalloprotease [Robiginitalea sp. M366]|uniref:CPBP family intramembrane glutamic endopeptidase n=1 Tax=Robiginitalea aestuariiviva TaxID=3036903 RepID=UPI00240D83B0|nr:CPBP family intramembrane glutamic endopeptidase [Robiginitalea aestuariiviva]MDG1572652.1 CPBP family intramembrane metalloprotease [Robiginitalea aestuariiviva]